MADIKLSKCPKCNTKLEGLNAFCFEQNKYEVSVSQQDPKVDSPLNWSTSEVVESSCTKTEFECPVCGETLFSVEGGGDQPREVIDFLKGVVQVG